MNFKWKESLKGPLIAIVILAAGYFLFKHRLTIQTANALEDVSLKALDSSWSQGWHPQKAQVDWKVKHVAAYLSSGGTSVAVADVNGDGYMDLHFTDPGGDPAGKLYLNNQGQGFTLQNERIHLLPEKSVINRSAIVDLDDDGYLDLFLLGFCPRIAWGGSNGIFQETNQQPLGCGTFGTGFNLADLDGDGRLEVLIAPYLDLDFFGDLQDTNVMPTNFSHAMNGTKPLVFRRTGRSFQRIVTPIQHQGWAHSLAVWRMPNSKDTLLWFANDYGVDRTYFVSPKGVMAEVSDSMITDAFSRNGMNSEIVDLDGNGRPSVYVSQIYLGAQKLAGNMFWRWSGGQEFVNKASDMGIHRCGWSWGAKFFDMENDGDLDLFVGNGFFAGEVPGKSYWYFLNVMDAADKHVLSDALRWPAIGGGSLSGEEKACLFVNDNGRYKNRNQDVKDLADFTANERGVALVDLDNSGRQALATVSWEQGPRIYRWEGAFGSWIGFDLHQSAPNKAAWGASVILKLADGRTMGRQKQPLNAYAAQSDARLHFGLGKGDYSEGIAALITWPDGTQMELKNLKVGEYHSVVKP
ncbi:FG-GAP-like repeat-containing protein [Bdellovibrio sp. HCB288]|uniref:FG-GAP-like repeat-containing protein n=1 Tax=Bdellovibrio sp. HCB288 TaxID=3394355 RepID=UPI0039B550E3